MRMHWVSDGTNILIWITRPLCLTFIWRRFFCFSLKKEEKIRCCSVLRKKMNRCDKSICQNYMHVDNMAVTWRVIQTDWQSSQWCSNTQGESFILFVKHISPLDLYMLKYICRILIKYICRNILLTLENECASSSKHAFSHSIRHLHSLLMVISPFHFGILPKIKSLSTKNKGMSNRCELHAMIMDVFTTLSFGKTFGK